MPMLLLLDGSQAELQHMCIRSTESNSGNHGTKLHLVHVTEIVVTH
jgi:hypothetical protein